MEIVTKPELQMIGSHQICSTQARKPVCWMPKSVYSLYQMVNCQIQMLVNKQSEIVSPDPQSSQLLSKVAEVIQKLTQ